MKKKKSEKKKKANETRLRVKDKKSTDKSYIMDKGWMHGGINE